MFQTGERVGDYEVVQVLGAGGMGQVYKVRNTLSDRVEAMKVLLENLTGDAALADRFLREIKVQATLIHPNIAQLYTAQRHGDQILMLLEFVDGLTLDALLKRGALSSDAVVKIFTQVLDALTFAHARGVVHRDIKPQNIMVTSDGTAKLMDFGIARMQQDRRLTQTGRTVGSLYYMSPEQIRGMDDIDGRSDLYSLGITLYEAATGTRPFEGDSDYTIMAAHLQQPPIPPVERDPRLSRALSDVILAALEKDRDQRFQSADAFKMALTHCLSGGAGAMYAPSPHPHPQAGMGSGTVVSGPPPSPLRTATTPLPQQYPGQAPPPPHPQQQFAPQPQPMYSPQPAPMPMPAPAAARQRSAAGLYIAFGAIAFAAIAGVGYWQYPRIFGGNKPPIVDDTKPPVDPNANKQEKPADPNPPQQTDPAKTDPAKTDPAKTEPAKTEPAKTEPAKTEPAKTDPGKVDPVKQPKHTPQETFPHPNYPRPQDPPPQQQHPQNQQQQQQQQQQTTPVKAPGPTFQEPPVDPAVLRELEGLRQHFNQLSIRLGSCKEGMANLEAQQRSMGLGLRGDVKQAASNADLKMREAGAAIRNKDVETARQNLEAAERMIDFVGKAVGR